MIRITLATALVVALLGVFPSCAFGGGGSEPPQRTELVTYADEIDAALDFVVSIDAELAGEPYVLGAHSLSKTLRLLGNQPAGPIDIDSALAALQALEPDIRAAIIAGGRSETEAGIAVAGVRYVLFRLARLVERLEPEGNPG